MDHPARRAQTTPQVAVGPDGYDLVGLVDHDRVAVGAMGCLRLQAAQGLAINHALEPGAGSIRAGDKLSPWRDDRPVFLGDRLERVLQVSLHRPPKPVGAVLADPIGPELR